MKKSNLQLMVEIAEKDQYTLDYYKKLDVYNKIRNSKGIQK